MAINSITIESLSNSIQGIKKNLNGVESRVSDIEKKSNTYITQASLQSSIGEVNANVSSLNDTLSNLEVKLQKVSLPDSTRYYLEESEIADFRNHFRQLRTMMSELEKTRQSFIRLASRFNLTNSL